MPAQMHRPEPTSISPSRSLWHDTAEFSRSAGRSVNMDALGHAESASGLGIWVVADGLGGYRRSEVASKVAVNAVISQFRASPDFGPEAISTLFAAANAAVLTTRAS